MIVGADVLLSGCPSKARCPEEMVQSMNKDPIIFAMANPNPEIMPEEARTFGARVVGTGRSDFPNQVNNVLAFPGIFRGALEVRAKEINHGNETCCGIRRLPVLSPTMNYAEDYVIPAPFDPRVAPEVAAAVAKAAMETGAARIEVDLEEVREKTRRLCFDWLNLKASDIPP